MRPLRNIIVGTDGSAVRDMTRILLIRHGQSVTNLEKRFTGFLDSPLSDLGIRQAQLTGEYIAQNYRIDRIYASDLCRAYQTGQIIAQHYDIPVVPVKELREINGGLWEGHTFDELNVLFPESFAVWHTDIGNAVCDGGESVATMHIRVLEAIQKIALENPDQTVLIACHGTPIRAIQCYCEGKHYQQMKDVKWVSNASVTELIFRDNRFRLERVGYDAHLGQLTTVLPANC